MSKINSVILSLISVFSIQTFAASGKYFDRAIFVVFENENYSSSISQPFFKKLAQQGAHFTSFMAEAHPSQGNYVALTSGSLNGVANDNPYDINSANIADLLEAKGLTWKVYAEAYPENCFTGKTVGTYARKHNPFISYLNIQKNKSRCANIVNASEFDVDAKNGTLPNYVFYVPDIKDDGHDTGVAYADKWYNKKFSPYLSDTQFMKNTVLISTFDESAGGAKNQIYTTIVGPAVKPSTIATTVNHYSLLRLIEDNWSLGSLGKQDATAELIPNIWF